MPDGEPSPIGPDIDQLLRGLVSDHIAKERERLVREHGAAILDVRERARRVWAEMLGKEITMLVLWGLGERVAEVAARNNLAIRKRDLDNELLAEAAMLQGELTQRLRRLVDGADAEDESGKGPLA